ncbi:MAG: alginate lyase family protein [Ignavibacteriaceae bacterium]|nr:alginate lyase family protein [Ignavibacteriaceae bacterium]
MKMYPDRLEWFLNRLITMSAPEIIYRGKQFLQKKIESVSSNDIKPDKYHLDSYPDKILFVDDIKYNSFDDIINIFGINYNYTKNTDWHLDIRSNKRFPEIFSKDIQIRSEKYGIAKVVWEVNRLQFLLYISLNYQKTKDLQHLNLFMEILTDWKVSNPFLVGINWYSNIEISIRLIVWFFCWEVLNVNELVKNNSKFHLFVENIWLPIIYLHCRYSYDNPSKYSSANNHLVAEAAGLFIASSYWKFEESGKWNGYSKQILEREIVKQHSKNGINKEEAAEYIQFITDFFLYAFVVGEKTNNHFSENYKNVFKKIFTYINEFLDVKSNFPKYGDEDDGKVVSWSSDNHFNNFKSLCTSGAIIFNDCSLKSEDDNYDLKNYFLFGHEGKEKYNNLESGKSGVKSKFYNEEGHFIFKNIFKDKEVYLHFDAASLGYLSIAAHGHADSLSFMLNIDGKPFIVDPGTYTYHSEPEWRKYFIGTLAHNTIRIDGKDQAVIGGPTMWLNHYKSKVIKTEQNGQRELAAGTHNGYNKIGVEHSRSIEYYKSDGRFIIEDNIKINDAKSHIVEIPFHLHPEIKTELIDKNIYLLCNDTAKIKLHLDDQLSPQVIRGQTDPILGWYSPSFYNKEQTSVVYSKIETDKTITIRSEIQILE